MISIIDAAKYIVFLSHNKKKGYLDQLVLQKILYLAQGWSFVWDNKPLFNEDFEAWQFGPANREVYFYFRQYGRGEIPSCEGLELVDREAKDSLYVVWNEYYRYSTYDLAKLTFLQQPFQKALLTHDTITKEDIKSYFRSTYQ